MQGEKSVEKKMTRIRDASTPPSTSPEPSNAAKDKTDGTEEDRSRPTAVVLPQPCVSAQETSER